MPLVVPNAVLLDQLTAMIADEVENVSPAGLLNGVKVRLYTNNLTPDEDTILTDFTQATFTGYAAEDVEWNAPIIDNNGRPTVVGETTQFVCTSAPDPAQSIYGYYVTNTAGNALVYAERFPGGPTSIVAVNDAVVIVPKFSLTSIE